MPITDVLIVTAVVLAFVIFAVVLAWGEYQTRHIAKPAKQVGRAGEKPANVGAPTPPDKVAA